MDLEKFFDKVNHDILMSKLEKKIKDKRMLTLIRKYLKNVDTNFVGMQMITMYMSKVKEQELG